MPIYKYTLQKYATAWSTWIIVVISMLLVIVLGGYVPFKFANPKSPTTYAVICVSIVAAITSFLSIFTSVFAGFKSATMFKDEVEDGTFLVMLSKPVSRGKIIFYKWLALQTAIAVYTLIVAISFLVAIAIFDTGNKLNASGELTAFGIKTLRSQIILISLSLWAILFIVALIFSSIALLLSTKLSVGTTIGISIAIGVIIPVTALVGTFTSKPAYKSISNSAPKTIDTMLGSELITQSSAINQVATAAGKVDLLAKLKSFGHNLTDNPKTLYGLGLATNEKDTFRFAQAFDFNYQIQKLSEFASEQAIPETARGGLNFSHGGQSLKTVTNIPQKDSPFSSVAKEQIEKLNEMILSSWEETQPYREAVFSLYQFVLLNSKINNSIPIPSRWITGGFVKSLVDDKGLQVTSITDANKLQVIAALNEANGVGAWIDKTIAEQKAFANKDEEIRYAQANIGMADLMESFEQRPDSITLPADDSLLSKSFLTINGTTKQIFSPLTPWTTIGSLQSFKNEHDFHINLYLSSTIDAQTHPDDSATDSLGYLRETLRMKDESVYNYILSAIDGGYSIAKIKTVEYTNKWTILWIYLAFALALVPVAYIVVRKQDFR